MPPSSMDLLQEIRFLCWSESDVFIMGRVTDIGQIRPLASFHDGGSTLKRDSWISQSDYDM